MVAARTAAKGLSTSDLEQIRDTTAAGRKPKVVVPEAAGQHARQLGRGVRGVSARRGTGVLGVFMPAGDDGLRGGSEASGAQCLGVVRTGMGDDGLAGARMIVAVGGALITEAVFNFPGMGQLFWTAAQTQDYPIMLGITVLVGVATVIGSLLADLAYAALDPRVRYA